LDVGSDMSPGHSVQVSGYGSRVNFARSTSYATSHSPFKVCYGLNPLTLVDLTPIPQEARLSLQADARAKEMKKLPEQGRAQLKKVNEQCKQKANRNCPHL